MSVLRKSMSFSLMGTLAASCLLLVALWAQEADALPINSQCKLEAANFQQPYIVNRTFMLAQEASLADNNTDVRLIGEKLFQGVNAKHQCYLMKQVLNFTLEDVLLPQSDRFQPYMQEVVSFLIKLSNQLSSCHISGDDQHIQKNVSELKETVQKVESFTFLTLMEEERGDVMTPIWTFTSLSNGADKLDLLFTIKWKPVDCLGFSFVKKLGESGEIKAIGELDLLFMSLRNACV